MQKTILCMMAGLLGACDGSQSDDERAALLPPTPAQISFAEEAMPTNENLAEKYDRSCRSCHSLVDAAAPLTGHNVAWKIRLDARDWDGLLASTRNGFNAMPINGYCNDCSDDDLIGLIEFMSGETKP